MVSAHSALCVSGRRWTELNSAWSKLTATLRASEMSIPTRDVGAGIGKRYFGGFVGRVTLRQILECCRGSRGSGILRPASCGKEEEWFSLSKFPFISIQKAGFWILLYKRGTNWSSETFFHSSRQTQKVHFSSRADDNMWRIIVPPTHR